MRVFVFRHGPAAVGTPGRPDAERPLTPAGSALMARVADRLAGAGALDQVVTSPYRRAHQTGRLLAEAADLPLETDRLLAPGFDMGDVAELLSRCPPDARVALVSHMPDVALFVRLWTGQSVHMTQGAVAVVEADAVRPGTGRLVLHQAAEALARRERFEL